MENSENSLSEGGTMRVSTAFAWLIVVLTAYYVQYGQPYLARQYAYPLAYESTVMKNASTYHVRPSMVAAVIYTESKFDTNAKSLPGAIGLMQLMPETAHWIGEQLNQSSLSDQDIKEPNTNIQLGTWYLSYLLEEFKGNEILALAAYNAGRGHVEEWMQTYGWDDNFDDINKIPFPETKDYVKRVIANESQYQALYSQLR